jgi:predicted DNA-binding transcriptional regulator AlpA
MLRDHGSAEAITPLLVDIVALSKLLQRSVASLHRDDVEGRLPEGLKIGGSKRWRYSEIVAWIESGAPNRQTWARMRSNAIKYAETGGKTNGSSGS